MGASTWRAGLLERGLFPGLASTSGILLILLLFCCGDTRPPRPEGLEQIRGQLTEVLAIEEPRDRLPELLGLESRLEHHLEASREARQLSLVLDLALAAAYEGIGRGDRAEALRRGVDERGRGFLARDPADGAMLGYLVQRLVTRGEFEAACGLARGAGERVDLDTAERFVSTASALDQMRHLGVDPQREGSRIFERICADLVRRTREAGGREDLLGRLMSVHGLTLLGMGRVKEARQKADEMAALGLTDSPYFRLRTALSGQDQEKR